MRQYLLKNLFLSSLLTLVLYSCSPTAGYKLQGKTQISEAEIHPILQKTGSLLFKTKIDLYNKHYSGLIILKQTDSIRSHLTFVTEVGMKVFDYEIQNHALKLVYIFEPLNKPKLIKLLTSDLELLLLQKAYNKEASVYKDAERVLYTIKEKQRFYYVVRTNTSIENITVKASLFTKIKLHYSYKNELNIEEIHLKHKGLFPLKMKWTALPREN